jgi:SAM-dependent methyltransferase
MGTPGLEAVSEQVRDYWDIDAATYDHTPNHNPRTALELAAWAGALRHLLPSPPARVLDVGTGTGFLALMLAKHGFEVSALDLSAAMLRRLNAKADAAGLEIKTIHADASETPLDGFDAVVERHVLWTVPGPKATLEAWCWWRAFGVTPPAGLDSFGGRGTTPSDGRGAPTMTITLSTAPNCGPIFPFPAGRRRNTWSRWWSRRPGAQRGWRDYETWSGPPARLCPHSPTG